MGLINPHILRHDSQESKVPGPDPEEGKYRAVAFALLPGSL